MDYNSIQKKIFVSYSDLDRKKMRVLEKIIRKSPFLPIIIADNREAMISLSDKIIEGIESADYIIPILTSASISTQWINQEIGYSKARGKQIMPIVEREVMTKLRGFIHSQLDLSYNFALDSDKAKERLSFRKCCDKLVDDLVVKVIESPDQASELSLAEVLPGRWRNDFQMANGRKGFEVAEFRRGNRYYVDGIHTFDLEDVYINKNLKTIRFVKKGIGSDARTAANDLKLDSNNSYSGPEGPNKVVYRKL